MDSEDDGINMLEWWPNLPPLELELEREPLVASRSSRLGIMLERLREREWEPVLPWWERKPLLPWWEREWEREWEPLLPWWERKPLLPWWEREWEPRVASRAQAELLHRRRELGNRLNVMGTRFDSAKSDVLRIVASILPPLSFKENLIDFVVAPVLEGAPCGGDHAMVEVVSRLAMVLCRERGTVVARSGNFPTYREVCDSRGIDGECESDGDLMNRTSVASPGLRVCDRRKKQGLDVCGRAYLPENFAVASHHRGSDAPGAPGCASQEKQKLVGSDEDALSRAAAIAIAKGKSIVEYPLAAPASNSDECNLYMRGTGDERGSDGVLDENFVESEAAGDSVAPPDLRVCDSRKKQGLHFCLPENFAEIAKGKSIVEYAPAHGAASFRACASQEKQKLVDSDEDALSRADAIAIAKGKSIVEYGELGANARAGQRNHLCQRRATGNEGGTSTSPPMDDGAEPGSTWPTPPHTSIDIGSQEGSHSHRSETDPPAVGSWALSGPTLQVITQVVANELSSASDKATDPRLKAFLKTTTLIGFAGGVAGIGMQCAGRSLSLVMFRIAATATALSVIVALMMDLDIAVALPSGAVAFLIAVASIWQ